MSNYSFSNKQRHALFTVHGGKCYLCSQIIDLISMEIDHIVPERLDGESELNEVIELYGLPLDFDVNTYDNWRPSCRSCNGKKGGRVFNPSLLLQRELEFASEKAGKYLEAEKAITNNAWVSRSFAYLKRAHEDGSLAVEEYLEQIPVAVLDAIQRLSKFQQEIRPTPADEPLQLTPRVGVLFENDDIRVIQGQCGIGTEHKRTYYSSQMRCGSCGSTAFNGARCITCGDMSD